MIRAVTGRRLKDLPLWRPKFTEEVMKEKSADKVMFSQGYRMQVIQPGDLRFPSFAKCYDKAISASDIVRRGLPTYIGVDLSSAKRKGNTIVAVALNPMTQHRMLAEVRHGAWTSPETAKNIGEVAANHDTRYVMVENNAYQESIIEWVKVKKHEHPWWAKLEAHTTGKNKADPNYGLDGLEVEFHNQAWVFPSNEWDGHEANCACSWCEFARQMAMYPAGTQTDFVMSLWFSWTAINRWGVRGGAATRGIGNINVR